MATRVIDDSKLQDIAVAIQGKDGGGGMTVDEMPTRIAEIPTGGGSVEKKDVNFYDWDGTLLFGYSVEEVQAMTSLPAPDTSPNYQTVDHDLLTFQEWNWSFANIKTWVQNHSNQSLGVGAIYTTTDLQNHNYWGNPRLDTANTIIMQKRRTASIGNDTFRNCYSLTQINIPDGVTSIGYSAFNGCYSLTHINIPDSVTSIRDNAFNGCYSLTHINIPDSVTNIENAAFRNCYSLTQINIPDGVTSIGNAAFRNCYSLTQINIPDGVTNIGNTAFSDCYSLCDILLESKPTLVDTSAFSNLPTIYRIYVPRENLSWSETATNWSTIYTQGHIVAIEDYIEYLESIGFNVDDYKEVTV